MRFRALFKPVLLSAIMATAVPALAEEESVSTRERLMSVETSPLITNSIIRENELLNYCLNVSDVAAEARSAVLKSRLEAIEAEVDDKLDELATRIEILKNWAEKRREFLETANDSLVKIFETMRPDAAAQQFAALGPALAAAIVVKLDPKVSSAILTEMRADEAAKITTILTGAIRTEKDETAEMAGMEDHGVN